MSSLCIQNTISIDQPVSPINTLNADGSLHFDGTYGYSAPFSQNLYTLVVVIQRSIIHYCIAVKKSLIEYVHTNKCM